ncbi:MULTISPECIES: phosphorothioated DNA-binding restriction endonuclease [unclassified Rubrivivax]|uniref:phosphorothioated DNA-binding restriction endonuclease n=1 Tax=unclassified Rubrivivax TaxID=2649762 RepID=UPI001E38EC33|nr:MULTISPECIES: HNH endonuclease [unclassified Rubrivivax]MCC9598307.1 HNH endonuclease [Rubrivivax sp. JA1055]MCC9645437.1 HNH endonuclease [Rubrivivax sp. JA1029]
MIEAQRILEAFDGLRRAQRAGVYAPHKPLLILLALARVQRGEQRLVDFGTVDAPLRALLTEFGPSSAPKSRHYPFWHLATDGGGALWELRGPRELLSRPPGATPNLGELRAGHVEGGFPAEVDRALREVPGLLEAVASRVLEAAFPATLHTDIAAAVGLTLHRPSVAFTGEPAPPAYANAERRRRDPAFRERVLRAYEYRCCVCGFDLRIGTIAAGLEAAHIQWHHVGGPDVETNGLALCALHHKLFDLGAFTVEPHDLRVVFSQHAIAGDRSGDGALRHHGRPLLAPQHTSMRPAAPYLAWNMHNVFKGPARQLDSGA